MEDKKRKQCPISSNHMDYCSIWRVCSVEILIKVEKNTVCSQHICVSGLKKIQHMLCQYGLLPLACHFEW